MFKKTFFIWLTSLIFSFSIPANAELNQTCQCSKEPGWAPTCEQCLSDCSDMAAEDLPSSRIFEDTSTCGGPDPDLGGVICNCSFESVIPASGSCLLTDWTCRGEVIIETEVDIGDTCARQEDCVGTTGDCGASRCFCNATTSRCTFKKEASSECAENFECVSNICRAGDPSAPKQCVRAGLTPPTGTDGGTNSETPPLSEEEVFPTYQVNSPIGEVTGPELIGRIIKTALGIVGALALAMFIYGGFTWLTSGGSTDKIKKGKDVLMWATIGLVVIFASYTLVDFLLQAFGV